MPLNICYKWSIKSYRGNFNANRVIFLLIVKCIYSLNFFYSKSLLYPNCKPLYHCITGSINADHQRSQIN